MRWFLSAAVGILLIPVVASWACAANEIIPQTTAQRYGLSRPWIAQVQMDRGQGRIRDIFLYEGILYVQTNRAMLQAIDAETGKTLWAKQIGRPGHPSMTPGACRDLVGTINGSRLFVMNRYTGEILFETTVNGAPGAGPALSTKRAYVPMVSGLVLAYRLEPITDPIRELAKVNKTEPTEEEKKAAEEERRQNIRIRQDYVPPLASQSAGRALVQPLVTFQNRDEEYCAWGTDRGFLNIGRIDRHADDNLIIKSRLTTGEAIAAPPAYLPPDPTVLGDSGTIFAASRDGFVYALLERSGELLWKFSAAEPIVEPPVVLEDRLYATTQCGGLYCLDAKSGKQLWWAPEILRFLAQGKQRVYTADKFGRLRILDRKNGSPLDSMPTEMLNIQVINGQTDRIFLATDTGLVQCLHEIEQVAPVQYNASRKLPLNDEELPKPKKGKAAGEDGEKPAHKPAAKAAPKKKAADDTGLDDGEPAPKAHKAAPKAAPKKKADDIGFGDGDDSGDAKPAKTTKGKAPPRTKAAAKGRGKAKGGDEEPDANNPFSQTK